MSAKTCLSALRARIAEALESYLQLNSHREIGDRLGRAGTTVSRRGSDLREWPADELLHLASRDHLIAESIKNYLDRKEEIADERQVDRDLMATLPSVGQLLQQIGLALSDQHVDLNEARRLLPIVQQAQTVLAKSATDLAEQIRRGAA